MTQSEPSVMMMVPLRYAQVIASILESLTQVEFERVGPEPKHFGMRADNMAQYASLPSDPFSAGLMDG